jgi:hypothetical protein
MTHLNASHSNIAVLNSSAGGGGGIGNGLKPKKSQSIDKKNSQNITSMQLQQQKLAKKGKSKAFLG